MTRHDPGINKLKVKNRITSTVTLISDHTERREIFGERKKEGGEVVYAAAQQAKDASKPRSRR